MSADKTTLRPPLIIASSPFPHPHHVLPFSHCLLTWSPLKLHPSQAPPPISVSFDPVVECSSLGWVSQGDIGPATPGGGGKIAKDGSWRADDDDLQRSTIMTSRRALAVAISGTAWARSSCYDHPELWHPFSHPWSSTQRHPGLRRWEK
jgi:hypothetical protein